MLDVIQEPEVRIHFPPAKSQQTSGSARGDATMLSALRSRAVRWTVPRRYAFRREKAELKRLLADAMLDNGPASPATIPTSLKTSPRGWQQRPQDHRLPTTDLRTNQR